MGEAKLKTEPRERFDAGVMVINGQLLFLEQSGIVRKMAPSTRIRDPQIVEAAQQHAREQRAKRIEAAAAAKAAATAEPEPATAPEPHLPEKPAA